MADKTSPLVEVEYRELSVLEQGLHRCQYLMENKMQCPTHAFIVIAPEEYVCMYHFNLIKLVRSATGKYKFIQEETPETPEYEPETAA